MVPWLVSGVDSRFDVHDGQNGEDVRLDEGDEHLEHQHDDDEAIGSRRSAITCGFCLWAAFNDNGLNVGTTTSETCLPSFSATATTAVKSSCSYFSKTSELSMSMLPLKEATLG